MPIWKFTFGMMAMSMYLGTPMFLVVPNGLVVVDVGHK